MRCSICKLQYKLPSKKEPFDLCYGDTDENVLLTFTTFHFTDVVFYLKVK